MSSLTNLTNVTNVTEVGHTDHTTTYDASWLIIYLFFLCLLLSIMAGPYYYYDVYYPWGYSTYRQVDQRIDTADEAKKKSGDGETPNMVGLNY